jgi:hypothetical protein
MKSYLFALLVVLIFACGQAYAAEEICEVDGSPPIFMCTIKKQPLTFCTATMNDTRIVTVKAKIANVEIYASVNDSKKNSPIKLQSVFEKPVSLDTIYFEENKTTYALTRCNGMCVQPPWFTIFKGNTKKLVAQCDEESVTVDNLDSQYKTDKKGRIIKDGLYQEKKSQFNFDAPN